MNARDRRRPAPARSKPDYTEEELAGLWDELVRFNADPFVRFRTPLEGSSRLRLFHYKIRWDDTRNPYYVWRAIDECIHSKRELEPWIVKYLGDCARRMLSQNSKHSKDIRHELEGALGFKRGRRKRGPGYQLRPDGDENAWMWVAVAEYFAAEIKKGATPVEARQRAHQRCLEYRYEAKPGKISGTFLRNGELVTVVDEEAPVDPFIVESLAADVYKKLFDVDDKTLRINIEKCFGVKKSPRTNAEWMPVIAAWHKRMEMLEALFRK